MRTFQAGLMRIYVDGLCGQFHDGGIWVAPGGRVVGWSPETTNRDGRVMNGAMFNPTGLNTRQALDSSAPYTPYDPLLAEQPGRTLEMGDVVVIARSAVSATGSDCLDWPLPFNHFSVIEQLVTVHCVNPSVDHDNRFRPPVAVSPWLRRKFCESPTQFSALRLDRLPRTLLRELPWEETSLRVFQQWGGDVIANWPAHIITPRWQHPGYSPDLACQAGMALLLMCRDVAPERKTGLARKLVQHGLDYGTSWTEGRVGDDGHFFGRKALILFAAHLLELPYALQIDNWPYQGAYPFPESNGRSFITRPDWHWFHNPDWRFGWRSAAESPWSPVPPSEQPAGWYLSRPPEEWSPSQRWSANGYMSNHTRSLAGLALAMDLMGLRENHGTNLHGWMNQWFSPEGLPEPIRQRLVACGVNLSWGESRSSWDHGIPAELWRAHVR